ncbi:MAG TPA: DNA methyltransferase [Pilimelia sp.]|nr:DNA methyltransferase [Pilimelia sp.]
MPEPTASPVPQGSVFLTGQTCAREQRRGRYTPESMQHPGKMLPATARYLIATYTTAGEYVADPMAGIGTTIVEAMHLGRHGIGVEYEPRWATLAADNIRLATNQGATGTGEIYQGDSRRLPALIPPTLHGRIALVITSPPYGASTHGHVCTPGARRGKVRKIHHKYGADAANLAYTNYDELAAAFTQILTGCAAILQPGGHVAITARPYRRHGELIDIPGMVVAAGTNAGLHLIEECATLIAGIRNGKVVPRSSFFQLKNARAAIEAGDPQWIAAHEDVLIFGRPEISASSAEPKRSRAARHDSAPGGSAPAITHTDHRLDASTPSRMDRRVHRAHPANASPSGSATDPRSYSGRDLERTPDPCPPYSGPIPGDIRPRPSAHRRPTDPDRPHPPADTPSAAGRR